MQIERRHRRRIGLFWKILLFAGVASLVPLVFAMTTSLQIATDTADHLVQRNVLQLANRISERITYTLVSTVSDLDVLRTRRDHATHHSPREENGNPHGDPTNPLNALLRDFALDQRRELQIEDSTGRRLITVPKYREVALYLASGEPVVQVVDDRVLLLDFKTPWRPNENRWCETKDFIAQAVAHPKSVVVHAIGCHLSVAAYTPADGVLGDRFDGGIRVSQAILDTQGRPREVATLVLSELHLSWALQSLSDAGGDPDIWGVLVDSEGWALSHPDPNQTRGQNRAGEIVEATEWSGLGALRLTGKPAGELGETVARLLKDATHGHRMTDAIETPDGKAWLVASDPVQAELGAFGPDNPLGTVLVFYPRKAVLAVRSALQMRYAILMGLTALLVLLASFWLARQISSPIAQLSRAARSIALGQRIEVLPMRSDELGDLTRAFEQMQADLETHQEAVLRSERLAAVGRFVAGIIHEVKNVLAGLGNYVSVLERRVDDTTTKEVLIPMRRALGQLDSLVLRMRELALRPRFATTDLPAVLEHAIELVEPQAEAARITLSRDIASELQLAAADGSMLGQVFLNILLNALQAAPPDSVVSVTASARGDRAVVQIRDSGEGFAPEAIDSLAEPFYTTREDGTGLGLYISKAIIVRHGGSLHLDNHPDGGAIVEIHLPTATEESGLNQDTGTENLTDLHDDPAM